VTLVSTGLARLLEVDGLVWYDPTITMDELHRSQARKRFLLKPNQSGGTYAWGAEVWWALTDSHPYRENLKPGVIWCLIENLQDEYRTICAKLHALEPTSQLHPDCRYIDGMGYRYKGTKQIVTKAGRICEFKSGTQEQQALESGTIAGLFINEPPKRGHWGAAMQRIAVLGAPVLMNFTAVGRPLEWLQAEIHGDPEHGILPRDPSWDVHIGELTVEACTTVGGRVIRTEESIKEQMLSTPAHEYAQRIKASWNAVTADRVFTGFGDHTRIDSVPARNWQVLLGLDHGELAGHEVALLILWCPVLPLMIIIDEYINEKTSNIDQDAVGIRTMLARHDMLPRHIDRAVGDTNSAGKSMAGKKVNDLLGEALGIWIRGAVKGSGSVNAAITTVNTALGRRHVRVHPKARNAMKMLQHWGGEDDGLKHFFDALHYVGAPLLDEVQRGSTPDIYMP